MFDDLKDRLLNETRTVGPLSSEYQTCNVIMMHTAGILLSVIVQNM